MTVDGKANKDSHIASEKDLEILNTPERLFHLQTWPDLKLILSENRLEDLKRRPGDLRRYFAWGEETRATYGSIQKYMLEERLHWGNDIVPINKVPFADERDTKVLYNDWPYGIADGIVHIVVWTKAQIPVDDVMGDVTPASRKLIEDYVETKFVQGLNLGKDRVMWFKNWASLQSVRTVEHFHVLVDINGLKDGRKLLNTVAS